MLCLSFCCSSWRPVGEVNLRGSTHAACYSATSHGGKHRLTPPMRDRSTQPLRALVRDIRSRFDRDSPRNRVLRVHARLSDADEGSAGERRRVEKYKTWVVTIEGHCDERGTGIQWLRRASRVAARTYLIFGIDRTGRTSS